MDITAKAGPCMVAGPDGHHLNQPQTFSTLVSLTVSQRFINVLLEQSKFAHWQFDNHDVVSHPVWAPASGGKLMNYNDSNELNNEFETNSLATQS